jgi:hypothetical protein
LRLVFYGDGCGDRFRRFKPVVLLRLATLAISVKHQRELRGVGFFRARIIE